MRINRRLAVLAGSLLIGAVALPLPASAAPLTVSISGTNNSNGTWFLSSTIRTVSSGSNDVEARFDATSGPTGFRIVDYPSGTVHGQINDNEAWQYLSLDDKYPGAQFRNNFRSIANFPSFANRNFTGQERY